MIKRLVLLLIIMVSFLNVPASVIAPKSSLIEKVGPEKKISVAMMQKIVSLSPSAYERATGIKLNFKQKIGYRLLQHKFKKQLKQLGPDDKEVLTKHDKTATLSMILGIAAFVFVFLPGIGIISIPMAVAAIVLGAVSIKKTKKEGRALAGILLGSIFLLLFIVLLLIISTSFF